MPTAKLKEIPRFDNEDQERDFWASHDSSDFVAWSKAGRFRAPDLRPSTRTISLRLPETLLESLKELAHQRDVPYQSLLKIFLAERVDQELRPR